MELGNVIDIGEKDRDGMRGRFCLEYYSTYPSCENEVFVAKPDTFRRVKFGEYREPGALGAHRSGGARVNDPARVERWALLENICHEKANGEVIVVVGNDSNLRVEVCRLLMFLLLLGSIVGDEFSTLFFQVTLFPTVTTLLVLLLIVLLL